MPARTRGRAKFQFRDRLFVWWVDADRWLRIASQDKHFVVAYGLGRAVEQRPVLVVHGEEFPGLEPSDSRPIHLETVELTSNSMGSWVNDLLSWCFDESKILVRADAPPRFS